jgi:hypothetical protein
MSSIANQTVGDYWVSTVTIHDLPYAMSEDHPYETVVFGDRGDITGKITHVVRYDSLTDAQSGHDKIVAEITAGTFVPDWPKKYGLLDINSDK